MLPQWIIEKKRDGRELSAEEIRFFIRGYTAGAIPDYQAAALAMAILWRDMSAAETAALTAAMRDSGGVLDISSVPGPKVDKHSTGGIGDKISLVLAPLATACGLVVPMISGRGLGITGGTLDKLEAIPGFRVALDESEILGVVRACGCCLAGQTARLAPADKKLYALRDVTGTVPSIPLITASILSKKLAAGLDGLVLDVKCGAGAFMKTIPEAHALEKRLRETAAALGLRLDAVISGMEQPLGRTVGNALEVREALETLRGHGPADVTELTIELGARMLGLGGLAADRAAGRAVLLEKLRSGAAAERFQTMVRLQGGDPRILERPDLLPAAPVREPAPAARGGFIGKLNAELVGRAVLLLGAGRRLVSDTVDHATGLSDLKKVGEPVQAGEPLAVIHARDRQGFEAAQEMLNAAVEYSASPVAPPPLFHAAHP